MRLWGGAASNSITEGREAAAVGPPAGPFATAVLPSGHRATSRQDGSCGLALTAPEDDGPGREPPVARFPSVMLFNAARRRTRARTT